MVEILIETTMITVAVPYRAVQDPFHQQYAKEISLGNILYIA